MKPFVVQRYHESLSSEDIQDIIADNAAMIKGNLSLKTQCVWFLNFVSETMKCLHWTTSLVTHEIDGDDSFITRFLINNPMTEEVFIMLQMVKGHNAAADTINQDFLNYEFKGVFNGLDQYNSSVLSMLPYEGLRTGIYNYLKSLTVGDSGVIKTFEPYMHLNDPKLGLFKAVRYFPEDIDGQSFNITVQILMPTEPMAATNPVMIEKARQERAN